MKRHAVLGAGPLGLAVTQELVQQGKSVFVVTRSGVANVPQGVVVVQCDLRDERAVLPLLKDVDIVYHCVGAPYREWGDTLPLIAKNVAHSAAQHQCKIVYADNLYAYGPQNGPLLETMIARPVGTKTKVRGDVAQIFADAALEKGLQFTIGRSSDFYGPTVQNAILGSRVMQHLMDGKAVELIGQPDLLHSHMYLPDMARALIMLGESDSTNGETYHLPHAKATTTRELVELAANAFGVQPTYRIAGPFITRMMGLFNADMRELQELLYQTTAPFVVDDTKFRKQFRFESTSHEAAIKETCAWYLAKS
ncbi:MAG: NAD-dependent epimerase/dehydratase family protein, partial [Bacilli bacterium]